MNINCHKTQVCMFGFLLLLIFVYIFFWSTANVFTFFPALFLIYFLGSGIRCYILPQNNLPLSNVFLLTFLFDFSLGFLALTILSNSLSFFYQFTPNLFFFLFVFFVLILGMIKIFHFSAFHFKSLTLSYRIELELLVIFIIISVFIFAWTRAPFPLFAGLDHFHYMVKVNKLLDSHGLGSLFLNNNLVEPHGYYVALGGLVTLFKIDLFKLFYYAPYFTFPAYGLVIFYLTKLFLKNLFIAFWAAFIGITIVGYCHFHGPHDIYSNSGTQLLFLLIWTYYYAHRKIKKTFSYCFFLGIIFLILFLIYPLIIVPFPLAALLIQDHRKKTFTFIVTSLFVLLTLFLEGIYAPMDFVDWDWNSFLKDWRWDGGSRALLFRMSYPLLYLLLMILGLFSLFFSRFRKIFNINFFYFGIYSIFIFVFFTLGFSSISNHLELYSRPFLTLCATLPVFYLFKISSRFLRSISVFLILILFISLSINFKDYHSILYPTYAYGDAQANLGGAISEEEFETLEWIKGSTGPNDYIVTDPYLGDLIRGYTNRQASSALFLPSGEAPYIAAPRFFPLKALNFAFLMAIAGQKYDIYQTEAATYSFYWQFIQTKIETELNNLGYSHEKIWLVLSSRTSYWLKANSFGEDPFHPDLENLTNWPSLDTWAIWPILYTEFDNDHFWQWEKWISNYGGRVVYQSPNIIIAELF